MDGEHITAELSGGEGARKKVHIYLKWENKVPTALNNPLVIGEGVTRKTRNGWVYDTSLSTGICA